jgi:hypothetical protein
MVSPGGYATLQQGSRRSVDVLDGLHTLKEAKLRQVSGQLMSCAAEGGGDTG